MGLPIARMGDALDSGGTITGSLCPKILANGQPIATIGAPTMCPVIGHGAGTIVESPVGAILANGMKVAVVGAIASCGHKVVAGVPTITAI
jgi:uncharacterized Zn-binding protein involved in type VI secretion